MLSRLQAEARKFLPDTATIYRPSVSSDGAGGRRQTLTAVGTAPARLAFDAEYAGARRTELAAFADRTVYWRVFLPVGTDVRGGDVIEVRGRRFSVDFVLAGRTYEVYTVAGVTEL